MGTHTPPQDVGRAHSPIFGPFLLWLNGWMDQDETWHAGRPRPWPHCVRRGPSSPTPKGHSPLPNFRPVYSNQTAAWIKMPFGTKVGLGPDDIVLDGDPAPRPQKGSGAPFPIFGLCLLWPNGWMDQDDTWHGGGPWATSDYDQRHVIAFRPISVAARGWSYDNNICLTRKIMGRVGMCLCRSR